LIFNEFIVKLKQQLAKPLPGEAAQYRMASPQRQSIKEYLSFAKDPKHGAVLILLYPVEEKIYTLLMLRPDEQGVHSGQVSFPGGKYEKEDGNYKNAALREVGEEFGLAPEKIEIIGELSPLYIPPSDFLVHPFVGFTNDKPVITPSKAEVKLVIETDIQLLLDDNLKERKTIEVRGYAIDAPYYNIHGNVVWGATAMILSEFEEIIKRIF
jgi:8-oxo-dGTP pyrophosphatase MutT (NUDIX family)